MLFRIIIKQPPKMLEPAKNADGYRIWRLTGKSRNLGGGKPENVAMMQGFLVWTSHIGEFLHRLRRIQTTMRLLPCIDCGFKALLQQSIEGRFLVIVGAFVGGFFIAPIIGGATINQGDFSLSGFVVSLLGAVVLLGVVNLFNRGAVR